MARSTTAGMSSCPPSDRVEDGGSRFRGSRESEARVVPPAGDVQTIGLDSTGRIRRSPVAARTVGSSSDLVTRAPAGRVQRTIWVYGFDDQWARARGEPAGGLAQPAHVPLAHGVRVGDVFDDTDPDLRLFSGSNAKVLGEPNRLFGYQQASPREAQNLQTALALAKLRLQKGLAAVQAGVHAAGHGAIAPRLSTVIEVAFNVSVDTAGAEQLRILQILEAGLVRLREGLASEGLPLVSATRMRMYGVYDEPAECSGWVPRGLTESSERGSPAAGRADLSAVSGDIHIRASEVNKDDFNVQFVADTIIHEAAHKFLGAWDYSYVGVPGSVGSGLQTKSGVASRAAGPARWDQAKEDTVHRAYAQIAQAIVANGLKAALPEALDRGRPERPADAPDVKEAKRVWALVKTWGLPTQPPPSPEEVEATIALLGTKRALASSAQGELKAFLKDKRYLAVYGNELNVKGHDLLFALPTGFLLKNADSWTELALTAGG
jgi:hypothetical protein